MHKSETSGLTSFWEPGDVAILEAAVADSLVRDVEVEVLLGHLVEELVGMLDALLVQFLILGLVDVGYLVLGVFTARSVGNLAVENGQTVSRGGSVFGVVA